MIFIANLDLPLSNTKLFFYIDMSMQVLQYNETKYFVHVLNVNELARLNIEEVLAKLVCEFLVSDPV